MRVLILGCGPAGLIAAHAAVRAGAEVAILSKARKSIMKGAQYLHRPIPEMSDINPFIVNYMLKGSPVQYRFKVYGPKWDGTVSPEDLDHTHAGWDIRTTYDRLWDQYSEGIQDWEATPGGLHLMRDRYKPDLVVSSIPSPLLCTEGHTFRSTQIFSTDGGASVGLHLDDNTVVCNGEESPRWYRAAKIQGWETIEWPDGAKPPVTPLWTVQKPTGHNCSCMPDVLRVGRYGAWRKGVLSHEAYDDVITAIAQREQQMLEKS